MRLRAEPVAEVAPPPLLALRVGEYFDVAADRLARARFTDLFQKELCDPERFQAVEKKIHHARVGLQAVKHIEAGKIVDVVSGKPARKKGR